MTRVDKLAKLKIGFTLTLDKLRVDNGTRMRKELGSPPTNL